MSRFICLCLIVSLTLLPAMAGAGDDNDKKSDAKKSADAAGEQTPLKAGPADAKEKVKPGKIDKDAGRKFKKTKSGLQYRILRKSDKEKPSGTDIVTMHFKGWLDDKDKTIFQSSYRKGRPRNYPLQRVMKGWTEGLQLIGKGGMIELIVPSELGYGKRGLKGHIPPNATLHFIIELVDFKPEVKLL